MKKALIVGASSAIAMAVARLLAADGWRLALAGRHPARLRTLASDLQTRGAAACEILHYDAEAPPSSAAPARETPDGGASGQRWEEDFASRAWGDGLDLLLVAHGQLPDQAAVQDSVAATLQALQVNGGSVIALLAAFARRFEAQGSGTMVALSSVAGDRGRQSNYVYGSAKAAVSAYCEGLRNRLHGSGAQALTVKPGPVDTPMTAAMPKGLLWSNPERVARDILRGVERGAGVLYTPWFWRYVMQALRALPEALFKRLAL